ncbi:DUF2232 domain-containing protein [Hyphomicrobium sp.]|uniref:DUF2232 domain-containing protein n=1 Tax=Hyphomicrobium sp. TaxID=82 RepID=UPI002FE0D53E
MKTSYLAGAGLGLVAAVMFASGTTGPMFARFLLMFFTPLPIALAGLGWGWRSAVLAGAVGGAAILAVTSPAVAAAFIATQAAPMVLLTYLALLSRPLTESGLASPDDAEAVEWYPVGRLVLWSAALAALMAITVLIVIGGDFESLRKAVDEFINTALEAGLPQGDGAVKLSEAELAAIFAVVLDILPAASAVSWMGSLLCNLWLAGRVTRASGQLGRPWPDLAALTYPAGTPLVFGAALLATLLTGYPGLAASALAGGLFLAYLLLGLAILHYVTRGKPWRPIALWVLYGTLLIVNIWIAILVAVLGLTETVLHLRARVSAASRPPPSNPHT